MMISREHSSLSSAKVRLELLKKAIRARIRRERERRLLVKKGYVAGQAQ